MPQFTFRPEFDTRDVAAAMGPFIEVVGYQDLKHRIERLAELTRDNNYARSMLFERYALEFELWFVVDHFRKYGRLPATKTAQGFISDQLRAYSFIWMLAKVHARVDTRAQARLRGRIQHAFTDEEDLLSIEHEMNTIGHLCRFGCQVTCHDLEGDGGYDFLAVRDGLEFDVECKLISADKGRQIHHHDVSKLGESFQRTVDWEAFRAMRTGALVRLHVADRLPRRPELLTAIAKDMAEYAAGGAPEARADWRVERVPFEIESSPFLAWGHELSMDAVHAFVRQLTGLVTTKLLLYAREGSSALVVSIESDRQDQILDHVYLEMKRAAKQLSGTRPGTLHVGFQDLLPDDVVLLMQEIPNGLDLMVTRLFANPSRRHLYGVTYVSQVNYRTTTDGGFASDGKVYRFTNPNNPFAEDQRLRLDANQLVD